MNKTSGPERTEFLNATVQGTLIWAIIPPPTNITSPIHIFRPFYPFFPAPKPTTLAACPLHPHPSLPPTDSPWSLVSRHRTSYFHTAKGRSPNSREDSSLRLILRPDQTASRSLTGSLLLWSSLNNSHVIGEFCQAELQREFKRVQQRQQSIHGTSVRHEIQFSFFLSPLNLGHRWRHGTPVVLLWSGYHKKSLPR